MLCGVFVAIGIFGLTRDMPVWAAWLNIIFFGLGCGIGFFHLFDRRPQIIINKVGIYDRMAYKEFINWDIIYNAYPKDIYRQMFICLVVDENFKPSNHKGKWHKKVAEFSEAIGAQELNISLGQIKIDPLKLTEFIVCMAQAQKPDRDTMLIKTLNEWKA